MTTAISKRHRDDAVSPAARQLVVGLATDLRKAPSPEYQLLAAFHFGDALDADGSELIISPGLRAIRQPRYCESWWYKGNVNHTQKDDIRISESEDYAFFLLQRSDVPSCEFREFTQSVYRDLLDAVAATEHTHVARIWNYFPSINQGDGDDEKYRQFSIGRAEAFRERSLGDDRMPAGTAVGCPEGDRLTVTVLASRHEYLAVENPRQVSAYHYPRQYGPKSPKFSRGGLIAGRDHDLFLISGTASVVGHQTAHPNDTSLQTDETIRNLRHLMDAMKGATGHDCPQLIDASSVLHVYLRNPSDSEAVARRLGSAFGDAEQGAAFLHADICRRELMVEIDGVKVV